MSAPIIGPEITVNANTAGEQMHASVAAINGRFVIAWRHGADYAMRLFSGTGQGLSENVIDVGASATLIADRIEIAHLPSDDIGVAFVDTALNGGDVLFRLYRSNGTPEFTEFNASVLALDASGEASEAGADGSPHIGSDASGRVAVGFIDDTAGNDRRANLTFEPFRNPSPSTVSFNGQPGQLAELEGYLDGGSSFTQAFRNESTGNVHILSRALGQGSNPHVAPLADGGNAVVYQGTDGIKLRVLNSNLSDRAPEIAVTFSFPIAVEPHVTALRDGRLMVVWTEVFLIFGIGGVGGSQTNSVLGRIYNADGTPDSAAFVIDTLFSTTAAPVTGAARAAELEDGRVVVTYQDGFTASADIKAKILDPRMGPVTVTGSAFTDDYVGTRFDDLFTDQAGTNTIHAGEGKDTLVGAGGSDFFHGEGGDDLISPGGGFNQVSGGPGDDRFKISPFGDTTIQDFVAGPNTEDRLDLGAFANLRTIADVLAIATEFGGHTQLSFGNGRSLTLLDVLKADLAPADFIGLGLPPADDFNGDGTADILWSHGTGAVALWQLQGGALSVSRSVGALTGFQVAGSGDFDGDGTSDVLFRDAAGSVKSWLLQGGQVESLRDVGQFGTTWRVAETGDFNGDGTSDVLWRHDSGAAALWQMQNGALAVERGVGGFGAGWTIAAAGDFDGDGTSDVVWRHDGGAVVLWEMQGGRVAVERGIGMPDPTWDLAAAGDVNGDGTSDILWRLDTGAVVSWQMNNGLVAMERQVGVLDPSWALADARDVTGNGTDDILWRHTNGAVASWEMAAGSVAVERGIGAFDPSWQILA